MLFSHGYPSRVIKLHRCFAITEVIPPDVLNFLAGEGEGPKYLRREL